MVGNFENWITISDVFSQFSAAHVQEWPEFHFRSNLKTPWAVSYSTTNFGAAYSKIYASFE